MVKYKVNIAYCIRRVVALVARLRYPGYGSCGRCDTPWPLVKDHTTEYNEGSGCFTLCENCWKGLSPEERLPYYKKLWDRWETECARLHIPPRDRARWEEIKTAVLAGK